jgi:hypothetical protein
MHQKHDGEKIASSTNVSGKTGYLQCIKLKLDPFVSPCTSFDSKWIKDLNIRPETLKLVKEKARNTLELIGIGNDFLNRTQMAQQLTERIDKGNYIN